MQLQNLLTSQLALNIAKSTVSDIANSTLPVPVAGSIACGVLAAGVVTANVAEDIAVYQLNGNPVQLAVNVSVVAGSTAIGGVISNSAMGPVGIGYGMLGGSLIGTKIKKQNYFDF